MALESMKSSLRVLTVLAMQGCAATATDTIADADSPDVVAADAQLSDNGRDVNIVDVQRPFDASLRRDLHLLLSGTNARPGSTVTAVAYLSDNARVVPTAEIRLSMDGGDANLGRIGADGYDRENGVPSTVTMDKVCYGNQGDTGDLYSSLLLPTSSSSDFGTVRIVNAGQSCPERFTDSGLRTAKVYISTTMQAGVFKALRAAAISEPDQPVTTQSISVIDSPWGDLAAIDTRLSSEIIMPRGETVLMIAARDTNGYGLGCVATSPEATFQDATSTNREPVGSDTNGCTRARNSTDLSVDQTITINTSHIAPGTRGYVTLFSGNATRLQLFARGRGRTDADDDWSLHALGNGLYILPMRAGNVSDRGDAQIWSGIDGRMEVGIVQVNIAN